MKVHRPVNRIFAYSQQRWRFFKVLCVNAYTSDCGLWWIHLTYTVVCGRAADSDGTYKGQGNYIKEATLVWIIGIVAKT